MGLCFSYPSSPGYPDGDQCLIANGAVLILCLPRCHLLMGDCPPGQGCIRTGIEDGFACVPAPTEQVETTGTCFGIAGCEAGSVCVTDSLRGCAESGGYGAPSGSETLGVCLP